MSHAHPTISQWTRNESDAYVATFYGVELTIVWTPNSSGTRGYFQWQAQPNAEASKPQLSEERFEELEAAMADAEAFAHARAAAATAAVAAKVDG